MNRRSLIACALSTPVVGFASEPSWSELVQLSDEYTGQCSRELVEVYRFRDYERWDLNDDQTEMIFSKAGIPGLVFPFQVAGTVSKMSDTWLWSWANDSFSPALSIEVERVREYGTRRNFRKLTRRKWSAQERDGWEMAAITNYLLKGKGVYRKPGTYGVTFMVFTGIRKVGAT